MRRGLYLFNLFINLIIKYMPPHEPTMQNIPNHIAYGTFIIPFIKYEAVVAPVAKIIMYIPELVATFGGTPKLISKGLKIKPPPNPRAPEIHPPNNENINIFVKFSLFS